MDLGMPTLKLDKIVEDVAIVFARPTFELEDDNSREHGTDCLDCYVVEHQSRNFNPLKAKNGRSSIGRPQNGILASSHSADIVDMHLKIDRDSHVVPKPPLVNPPRTHYVIQDPMDTR
jgi:hypothetical protein